LSQLFSPETNCKIVRILLRYALIYIIASQLVSLQDVFSIWLCSFQSTISAITLRALASGADFSNPLRLQVRFRSPFIQFSILSDP